MIKDIDELLSFYESECLQFQQLSGKMPRFIVIPKGKYEKCRELYKALNWDNRSPLVEISFKNIEIVPSNEVYFDWMSGIKEGS